MLKNILCPDKTGNFFFCVKHVSKMKCTQNGGQMYFCGAAIVCSFSTMMGSTTKQTDLNKISFRDLPCLLCRLRRHASTAAIRRWMTIIVFLYGLLQTSSAPILLLPQPCG